MNVHVELGCGNNRRDIPGWMNVGIDIIDGPVTDLVCNLGFEPIPIESDSVDLVQAYDFFEHVPKCIWGQLRSQPTEEIVRHDRFTPFIFVMNETFRILKDGGRLISETPFTQWAYNRDPTHVNWLAEDWYHYFDSVDNLYHDQGLVTTNFKLLNTKKQYEGNTLYVELKAVKADTGGDYSEPVI